MVNLKRKKKLQRKSKFGPESTRADRAEEHKIRMIARRIVYRRNQENMPLHSPIVANISKHHPEWGLTPQENEARMAAK